MKPITEQLCIAGTEPPDNVPEIADAIAAWLDAKVARKRAAEEARAKHDVIVGLYAEHSITHHPYTDPATGKPRRLWIAREPKAKTSSIAVPRTKKAKRERAESDSDAPDADVVLSNPGGKVEFRRVPRASVEKELAAKDGFAAVRERMEAANDPSD